MVVVLIWFQCDVNSVECGVDDNCGVGWCWCWVLGDGSAIEDCGVGCWVVLVEDGGTVECKK